MEIIYIININLIRRLEDPFKILGCMEVCHSSRERNYIAKNEEMVEQLKFLIGSDHVMLIYKIKIKEMI